MRDVAPHLSRSSLGNEDTTPPAPQYRVSDHGGMISIVWEAGRHGSVTGNVRNRGSLSPRIGRSSHGATDSGQAEMNGQHGTMAHGPEHRHLLPDGHGCPKARPAVTDRESVLDRLDQVSTL